jgi:antitoxin ParD1/3/4
MTIILTPEHEKLVTEAIRSGAYSDPDQVIGRALEVLSSEDEWLRAHRQAIHDKIGRGMAQLDRGEVISGEDARARIEERKTAFLARNSKDKL